MNNQKNFPVTLGQFGFNENFCLFPNGKVLNTKNQRYLKLNENRYTIAGKRISLKKLYFLVYGEIFCIDKIQDQPKEIWKEFPQNSNYLVSNKGRIKSLSRYEAIILTPTKNVKGYETVKINGKSQYLHKVIIETFVRKVKENEEIHHKDTNKSNNSLDNLIILTKEEHRKLHNQKRKKQNVLHSIQQ